jgi:hypothetical protein
MRARAPIVHHNREVRTPDERLDRANRPTAIRAKIRFWRAPMRREAGEHENFFIAKIRDSESAPDAFHRHQRRRRSRANIDR